MRVHQEIVLESTNLTDITYSSEIPLNHIYGYSIYILYTGDTAAMDCEFDLQVSSDGENWIDYYNTQLTGLGDTCIINNTDVFYKKARIKLTPGRGLISPTITVFKKGH